MQTTAAFSFTLTLSARSSARPAATRRFAQPASMSGSCTMLRQEAEAACKAARREPTSQAARAASAMSRAMSARQAKRRARRAREASSSLMVSASSSAQMVSTIQVVSANPATKFVRIAPFHQTTAQRAPKTSSCTSTSA